MGNRTDLSAWSFKPGDERAREAGRRGGAVTSARRRGSIAAELDTLRALGAAAAGVDVGATCLGVAVWVLGRVTSGAVPIRHAGDAADLVRVLVDVGRLVEGLPGSTSAVVHLSGADARARLAELAAIAAGVGPVVDVGERSASGAAAPGPASASAVAVAAADVGPVGEVDQAAGEAAGPAT